MKTMQSKTGRNSNKSTAAILLVFFLTTQSIGFLTPVYADIAPALSALPAPAPVTAPNQAVVNNLEDEELDNPNDFLMGETLNTVTAVERTASLENAPPARPGVPAITRPAAGRPTFTDRSPTFQWTASSGSVDHYNVIVQKRTTAADGTTSYEEVLPRNRAAGSSTSFTLLPLAPGSYRFTLNACATTDDLICSANAAYRAFDIQGGIAPSQPGNVQPRGNAVINNHMPEITWTESPTAASYSIKIDSVVNGRYTPKIDTVIYTNSYIPTDTLAPGTYRIRLWASNEMGTVAATNATFIIRDTRIVAQPAAVSVNGAVFTNGILTTTDRTPTIQFGMIPQATAYDLQITDRATGAVKVSKNNLTQIAYTLALNEQLFGGDYDVRVRARNSLGETAWGTVFHFSVLETLPRSPAKPRPRGQTTQLRPEFTWNQVEGAQSYRLVIQKKDAAGRFRTLLDIPTVSGTHYQPDTALEPGRYKVYVYSANTVGSSLNSSPAATLTILETAPSAPVITGPSGVVTGSETTLTWNPVDGARSYTIEVYSANANVGPSRPILTRTGVQTVSLGLRIPTDLPTEGNYSFQVRAVNNAGSSAYSESRAFQVQIPTPATPVMTTLGTQPLRDHTPTFTWSSISEASEYEIQILRADGTLVPPASRSTTHTFTPAADLASGSYRVMVRAFNGIKPGSFSAPVSFSINTPPQMNVQNLSSREGVRKTMILGPAVDADGEILTYTYSAPASLLNNGSFTQIGNQLTYTPNAGYLVSNAMIQVTANDGHETVSATVTLSINAAVVNRPNDPLIGSQANQAYWLDSVNTFRAWNLSRGMGVTVAVLDSGVDINHPDLIGQIFTNSADNTNNGVNEDGNFLCTVLNPADCYQPGYQPSVSAIRFTDDFAGWDFFQNDNNVNPSQSHHGTAVAGVIAANDNNGAGMSGIAPDSRILPARFYNTGSGTEVLGQILYNLTDSILYVAQLGAKVINISYGILFSELDTLFAAAGVTARTYLQNVINYVTDAANYGAIVVASSGNGNINGDARGPAALQNVISVGALNQDNQRRATSNFGSTLDFVAPGGNIITTSSDGSSNAGLPAGYTSTSGTSFSAPIVSGIIGLMAAQMPSLTHDDAMRRLRYSAQDLGTAGRDDFYGFGKVDAFRALSYDYYDNGGIRTQWLENADERGNTRLDFDSTGRMIGGNASGVLS